MLFLFDSAAADAPCRPDCLPRRCGDGVQNTSEVCNDGNTVGLVDCSAGCQSDETCGNGYLDWLRVSSATTGAT